MKRITTAVRSHFAYDAATIPTAGPADAKMLNLIDNMFHIYIIAELRNINYMLFYFQLSKPQTMV